MAIHPSQWTSDLDARYELLEEAGRGGMGVVYKVRDRETGEIVALKILKPDIAADRVAAERFLNEVRLSRRITHKNVTRVYEFTRTGSTAYLSMEYVEGESLRSIVDRMGAVNLRKGIQISRQICAALHEAHAQGIVHRDLKPENVMIDRAGHVKVMDFGIARLLDSSVTSTAGGIIGTPAYMAPEQAEGKEIDARTDVYALGLLLYEIFTGKAAFTGDTPMAVALKQIRETPAALRTIDPALPWELEAIVMRCLEKDRAQRYQSVEDLDAALAAVSTSATTTGSLPIDAAGRETGSPTWPTVAGARTTPLAQQTREAPPQTADSSTAPAKRPKRGLPKTLLIPLIIGLLVAVFASRDRDPIPYDSFTLDNGLKVLLVEDHSAPTIAVGVTYNVGAKDDPPGREGLAHLFEHMLFNGSLNVGKGEHHYLVTNQGGQPNGQTHLDHTQVWETLPANQLDLALFLESDRMRSLRLDQARLDTERATVIAERQQRVDNAPYGRVMEALFDLAYDLRPYKKTQLGTDAGLQAITLQEVNDFFRIFYAPNNATLVVTGAFDPDDARSKIEKYFEHIPAQPPAPVIDLTEPAQTAERRARIEDPFAPGPRTYLAYKTVAGGSDDIEPLMVLSSALSESAASRLHQTLVRETQVANGVGGSLELRKGASLLVLTLLPAPNRDEAAMLQALDAAIGRIHSDGMSDAEVRRARMRLRLSRANTLQQGFQRALLLGESEYRFGGAGRANRRIERIQDVTTADVNRVARAYLQPARRSILSVVRGPAVPPAFKTLTTPASSTVVASVERLNRAPVSREVLRVALPDAPEARLDNGLTVLVAEDRRVPLVSVRLEIRGAGAEFAPPESPAVPLVALGMLRSGSATRSSRQLAEEFDATGVTVSTGHMPDFASTYVQATGLSQTFDDWFPLVADAVLNPSFPNDELTVMKRLLAAEWQQRASMPSGVALERFTHAVHGIAPGRNLTLTSFDTLGADQLRAWHKERYVPQNAILSIAGDVDRDDAMDVVRRAMGKWAATGFSPPALQPVIPPGPRVFIIDRPGAVQTTLVVGGTAGSHSAPDQLALSVATRVLGGSPSSRLFIRMRDERGLTYGVSTVLSAYRDRGDWRAVTDITTSRAGEGIETLLAELRNITTEPIPAQELEDAKRSAVSSFALTLEQLQAVGAYISARRSLGLSADYWDRYPERLMAVTAGDVQAAAAKHINFARLQVVAVGDAGQLEPLLAPLGQVIVSR